MVLSFLNFTLFQRARKYPDNFVSGPVSLRNYTYFSSKKG